MIPFETPLHRTCLLSRDTINNLYRILMQAKYNYDLYTLLINRFKDEYNDLMTTWYDSIDNKFKFKYDIARYLIVAEYFLWVCNNDYDRIRLLLSKYKSILAIELANYDNLFEYPHIGNLNNYLAKIVKEDIKQLVKSSLGSEYKYWYHQKHIYKGPTAGQNGIFNSLTGQHIRPNNDTFSIEDFS